MLQEDRNRFHKLLMKPCFETLRVFIIMMLASNNPLFVCALYDLIVFLSVLFWCYETTDEIDDRSILRSLVACALAYFNILPVARATFNFNLLLILLASSQNFFPKIVLLLRVRLWTPTYFELIFTWRKTRSLLIDQKCSNLQQHHRLHIEYVRELAPPGK